MMLFMVKNVKRREKSAGRTGLMLVEVSVAVALSSLVLGLLVSMLVVLTQMDRRMQYRAIERQRQLELAERLRTDLRLATDVTLRNDKTLIVHRPDERQARYDIVSAGIRRTTHSSDGKASESDIFAIQLAEAWQIERNQAGRHPLIMVTWRRSAAKKPQSRPIPFLVFAALGVDVRETEEQGEQ